MKKALLLLLSSIILLSGCSGKEIKQLSFGEIEDLSLSEQVDKIIENTKLTNEFETVVEGNSVAIFYPPEKVPHSELVLSDSEDSFPNVAMTFAEHLSILDLDEIVINSYEPIDIDGTAGITRVSALFNKETVDELDFDKWKDEKKESPNKFYKYADAYLIMGNEWEKTNDDIKEKISNDRKGTGSDFWEYYGSYVDGGLE